MQTVKGFAWMASGLLGAAVMASSGARAESLIMEADVWCPVNCAPDAERPGVFVELATQIFAEAGIGVDYRVTNWARAVQDVRNGRANALIGAGVRDAPDFLFGKQAPGISRNCFYARPGSTWRYTGLASLAGVRLGVINGYSYGEELDGYVRRYERDHERLQLAAGEQALALNVRKVELGRLDALVENTWIMAMHMNQAGNKNELIEVGCRVPDVPIYIAFSPVLSSSARYRDIFDEGVRRYRQNGRLGALLQRYGIHPQR
ncbi:substrate-binding periplasmic protein [Phytopseudomonas punonensis]|uniref:Amino acid ABC transporter substrate-binding protein, PAAT family n=1 Tax=Phytopseudomonas punonensis TaxID=1220495 RepID=A0A1M7CDY6_9GAMM|nr:transporter substrate-binding domain-containing protein [Pseudomonas punonensis]SHL65393.1 amino acid ABC transporter substrate-binding protein, PAAT family [Pseudomonas punonensis]